MKIDFPLALAEVTRNNRVCPVPMKWHELYKMLPERIRKGEGDGWEPSSPLILGGWWYSSDADKALRLREHLEWAEKHNCLDKIYVFLCELKEEDWHHYFIT